MKLSKYIGETTFYDKKEMLEEKKPKSWLKSISAFANSKGGKLFFGINNNDDLVGLKNSKKDAEIISEIIKTKLDPIPQIELEILNEDNKEFIVLTVIAGNETPYYLIDGPSRSAYIRIGNESVIANSIQLKNLVLKGMNKTFDTLSTSLKKDRASFSKLKSVYYKRTGKDLLESDLLSFGLIDDNDYLTNAGALFADENLIYQSRIFATRWNGIDKVNGRLEALDDKEFDGSILNLLQNGEDFIKSNSKKMWKKNNEYRIEYPDYPERAIQESLVNALIHRDYSEMGSEVHIDMYDDRLEIYSPGGMIDGTFIQEQNLFNISSKRRNPVIADLFSRMNLMERRGSGLKKIIDSYMMQEKYIDNLKPEFLSTQSSFYIILKNLNYKHNNKKILKKNGDKKTAIKNGDKKTAIKNGDKKTAIKDKQKNLIINFATKNEHFTTRDIEELLTLKSSRTRLLLSELVSDNMLMIIGENRNRKYTLK